MGFSFVREPGEVIMDLQFKSIPFEVKATGADGSSFEGKASPFFNIDSYNEIVDNEAFNADLSDFLANGFIGGLNHDWDNPIGRPADGTSVQSDCLYIKGNVIDTSHGADVRKLLQAGVVRKLSIGYRTLGYKQLADANECMQYWAEKGYTPNAQDMARCQSGATVLTRIKLYEVSPVTVPANDLAMITAVKAAREAAKAVLAGDVDEKGACGSVGLPIAARDRAWDASAADKRVRDWAGASDAPNAKYRSAFFWYDDANPEEFGSYHLGFADVIDGKLTAVPRGIFAAAAALQGARGTDTSKYAAAKPKVETYYARMRKQFDDDSIVAPWADSGKSAERLEVIRNIGSLTDAEDLLRDEGRFTRTEAKALLSALKTLLRDAASDTSEQPNGETPEGAETDDAATSTAQAKPVTLDFYREPEAVSAEDQKELARIFGRLREWEFNACRDAFVGATQQ